MGSGCRIAGCSNSVQVELRDHSLCLEHFLGDVEQRIQGYNEELSGERPPDDSFRHLLLRFVMLTAAKLAIIGIQSPPDEQSARGRLLHSMLLLADLRERLEKTARK